MSILIQPSFTVEEIRILTRAIRHYQSCMRVASQPAIDRSLLQGVSEKLLDSILAPQHHPYATDLLLQQTDEESKD
jgi:hypothetical protein